MGSAQPLLKDAECQEMQLGEFDVLKATYGENKILDMRPKQEQEEFQPMEMQISLIPLAADSHGEIFVGADLYVKCPRNYPNVPPHFEIRNPAGINEQLVRRLEENLRDRVKKYVGKDMVLGLCFEVQSFLQGHNKPPLLKESCCYEEMMKTIKQREKEEEEQKKVLEKQSNIEKLQAAKLELMKKDEVGREKMRKIDMDFKTSLNIKEDVAIAANVIPDDDYEEKEEEDLRISLSEADADTRLQTDYTILEKLGHGAFGDVVKVQNLLDGRYYAIKRIPLNFNRNKTKKIIKEVNLLANLDHKNIVKYYTSWIESSSRSSQFASKRPSIEFPGGKNFSDFSSAGHKSSNSSSNDSDSDYSIDSLHDESTNKSTDRSSSVLFQASNSNLDNSEDDESDSVVSEGRKMPPKNQFLSIEEFNFTEIHEMTLVRMYVVSILEKIFMRHGALSYDVPTLMPRIHNIYPKTCNEVLLVNRSGIVFSLPYDSRVNFARYVRKCNIFNAKRFFIGKVYREIPKLQPKEFWECSFDVISSSPILNLNRGTEVIMIIQEIFDQLPGFSDGEFLLKFNHINFITAIMSYCQIPKDLHHEILLIFKECKDTNHQKSRLRAKFSNLGFCESDVKKFFNLIQKEDSYTGISNYLRSLPKANDSELALIGHGLEYFKNLLEMLETCNSKFQVVFSMRLRNNFHIYSGMSFQISRRCSKGMDVLASGGCYDNLFDRFEQLDSQGHGKRHGIGVSMSLEKIISSVRASQTLKEGKSFIPPIVELLVSSTQPEKHGIEMHQLTQMLRNLGISCKIFDEPDNTLQSSKNYCKTNRIPFLAIVDSQCMLIQIDSNGKEQVLNKEENYTKFADFLKKHISKESIDLNSANKGGIDLDGNIFNLTKNDNECTYEVKLVGSTGEYKESSKILGNLKDVLKNFNRNSHVIIFVLETPKDLLKTMFVRVKVNDEDSFRTSMIAVHKEWPEHKIYIQKLTDDVVSNKFRSDRDPVMILYNIEDDSYRVFM